MQTGPPSLSLSPIRRSYSSDNLADIAARVVQEFAAESDPSNFDDDGGGDCELTYEGESNYPSNEVESHADELNRNEGDDVEEEDDDGDDDDFEFVVAGRDAASSPISADEIFYNGQIRPIYPVFNRNLYFDGFGFVHGGSTSEKPLPLPIRRPPLPPPRVRIPLGKLMREDRDPPSCSSSEADELEGVPSDMYCIWKPKTVDVGEEDMSPGKCKKSKSVGTSSKRWKFGNLLYRSNSEGKDMLVFGPPKESAEKADEAGGGKAAEAAGPRRKARKGREKKASYLPYRKDLVGLFSNFHPF